MGLMSSGNRDRRRAPLRGIAVLARRLREAATRIFAATIVLAVGCLALGGIAVWLAFRPPREAPEAAAARGAIAAGRYEEADKILTGWRKAESEGARTHFLRGRVAVGLGKLPEAAEELRQIHDARFRDERELLQTLILAKAGQAALALPGLERAYREARTPDRQVDEALAKVYLETFDLKGAAAVLDRWAADFPDDPKPYLWRVEIHSREASDPGVLEADYREALARDPKLAPARLGLAEELRKAHRNPEAAAEYDAYLALRPEDASAHLGAGRNAMKGGDDATASRHLERAIALDPRNAAPHAELAAAARRRGDWDAALASVDRAIALDPHEVASRDLRSLVLARLGRADEAKAEQAAAAALRADLARLNEARRRLVDSPHDRDGQLEIARWMFDHGHPDEGARWARKTLGEHADDPEAARLLASYHQRRGEAGLANFYKLIAGPDPGPPAKRP